LLILYADMPGVGSQDPDVRFENGELIVQGHYRPRQQELEYLECEYGIGDFYRAFTISEVADANKISAELKQGVLTVHLPKTEAAKPRRTAVNGE
jgi:HSP20 family protein